MNASNETITNLAIAEYKQHWKDRKSLEQQIAFADLFIEVKAQVTKAQAEHLQKRFLDLYSIATSRTSCVDSYQCSD